MKEFKSETGVVVTLPESWSEVRFDQYLAIAPYEKNKRRYYLEVLANDVRALNALDAGVLPELESTIAFIRTKPGFRELKSPKSIAGIKPPDKINLCPLIQYWCVEQWVEEQIESGSPDDELTWYLPLLAVYLCPALTGETFTDLSQAEAIVETIYALPCTEAVPLARFFFRKYSTLEPSGRVCSQSRSLSQPKKGWLATRFPNWRGLLGRLKSNKSASVVA